MVKICSDELLVYLMQWFSDVRKNKVVQQNCCDALLVSVPKKGDLSLYDNWRGISLLDTVGKVFAKAIQQSTAFTDSCEGGGDRFSVWFPVQT